MRKYWFIFSIYWQEGLQQRSSFFVDRFRSFVVLISFYYLWTALLKGRSTFAGYDHSQMITYILGMNILRSLVFASRTYEIAGEINHGRLSGYLLKPINFFIYTFFRDLSEKSINLLSAIIEVFILSCVFHLDIRWPRNPATWGLFILAIAGATALYFLLSFMVGCWGFCGRPNRRTPILCSSSSLNSRPAHSFPWMFSRKDCSTPSKCCLLLIWYSSPYMSSLKN